MYIYMCVAVHVYIYVYVCVFVHFACTCECTPYARPMGGGEHASGSRKPNQGSLQEQ